MCVFELSASLPLPEELSVMLTYECMNFNILKVLFGLPFGLTVSDLDLLTSKVNVNVDLSSA